MAKITITTRDSIKLEELLMKNGYRCCRDCLVWQDAENVRCSNSMYYCIKNCARKGEKRGGD